MLSRAHGNFKKTRLAIDSDRVDPLLALSWWVLPERTALRARANSWMVAPILGSGPRMTVTQA